MNLLISKTVRGALASCSLLLAACSGAPPEQSTPPAVPSTQDCTQCAPYHACSAGTCIALLEPPTNLQATPGTGVVDLSWDPRPGATSYVVSAALREDPVQWTKLGEGAGTGAHIFGIPADTTVYFIVQAASSLGPGRPSAPVWATTALQSLTANGIGTAISLRWLSAGADLHFDVFRASAASGPFERVATAVPSPWADQGVGDAQTRWYRVRPSAGGADSNTASAITRPVTPSGLAATSDSSGDLLVAWNASAGAKTYILRWTTRSSAATDAVVVDGTSASLRLNFIGSPSRYQLAISAINDAGESVPSAPIGGLTAPAVNTIFAGPGRTHLTLATASDGTIAISRGTSPNGPWTPFATAVGTGSFVDTVDSDAPPWTTIWYRAQSIDADGPGDSSFASLDTLGVPDIENVGPTFGSGCAQSADFDTVGFAEQGFTPGATGTLMGVQASVSSPSLQHTIEVHVLDAGGNDLGHGIVPSVGTCPQPLTESVRIMYADLSPSGIHVTAGTPLRLQLRFVGAPGPRASAGITPDVYPGDFTDPRGLAGPSDLILRTFLRVAPSSGGAP